MSAQEPSDQTALMASTIKGKLNTTIIGHPLFVYERVTSTNSRLKELAEKDIEEGCTLIALEQTQGRGRYGHQWESPAGKGLYMSILLQPSGPVHEAVAWLSLLGGLAVLNALEAYGINKLTLKWPNDVLAGNRKISGILVEPRVGGESMDFAVLGIGVNILQSADSWSNALKEKATSCFMEGCDAGYEDITCLILEQIEQEYFSLRNKNREQLMQLWVEHGATPEL